ncbi:MAG: type II toxin-antitoxin system prevent-host-death family antitoxin [Verrucomicrobia bacterium]|nr:type II toxin-antitoxin system prevent-host-death family antitoxin [Verrucomicrobiota bacterium]
MNSITYAEARTNLADVIDQVCRDHVPAVVTGEGDDAVVMMPIADYYSLNETACLQRSARNRRRLADSIRELELAKTSLDTRVRKGAVSSI